MRLIDADAVCELFEPFTDAFTDVEVTSAYVQTLTLIHNAPSIDIVRCKECKHWHSRNCWGIPFSGDDASYIETEPNDFCSYGKARGERSK